MQPDTEPVGRNPEQFAEPNPEPDSSQWRTVGEVAALLGVSERAIQKRCTAGTVNARRVDTPKGAVWQIEATSIHSAQNRTVRRPEPIAEGSPPRTVRNPEPEPTAAPVSTHSDQRAPDYAARYVAQIEAENAFLRVAVEQHQRSEAELRAALREALRAQPRQLEQGNAAEMPSERAQTAATPIAQELAQGLGNAKSGQTHKEPRPLWKLLLGIR